MSLRFLYEAETEFLAAVRYYAEVDAELADDLIDALDQAVTHAVEFPHLGRVEEAVGDQPELRRYALRRFPYSLLTGMLAGEPVVVAFAHHKREPAYWADRLK